MPTLGFNSSSSDSPSSSRSYRGVTQLFKTLTYQHLPSETPNHVHSRSHSLSSFVEGGKKLTSGVRNGLVGLVKEPIEGYKQNGVAGVLASVTKRNKDPSTEERRSMTNKYADRPRRGGQLMAQ
ncbi:hypothetical protein BDV93DRAFT_581966 [Ceratobasidium sp. AG-I]|nr:hypothetical protein BDV93DRAFT_581966 [Ceratobasidium sp. AG-I]